MYEVEIKSLLGSKEKAQTLKNELMKVYPNTKLIGQGRQLNHYFNLPNDPSILVKNIEKLVPAGRRKALENVLLHGTKISLRTRDADGKIILVIKASVGDDTSSNGVKRMEFESPVEKSLSELDKILLDSGCAYQAKWSREREEYESGNMHVCIDKNAGYGYLAEFEQMVSAESGLESARKDLLKIMESVGAPELPQDRLERMFAHYNAHWPEYYGTEKIFVVQ